ncbi:MAG: ParB N-terminal domain-containing protein [Desulfuromonadaceae bacterium]
MAATLKTNKMKADKGFTPCPVDDEDELYPNGIFVFNITKMLGFICNSGISYEDVLVNDFNKPTSKYNDDYLAIVDVTRPIIIAEISPGRFNVIDGNHRMEKARRIGLEKIPAYRVGPEQHMQFLTTEQGYLAFVEYWNGKLKEQRRN